MLWRVDLVRYFQSEPEKRFFYARPEKRFFYEVEVIEEGVGCGNTPNEALDSVEKEYIATAEVQGTEYALVLVYEGEKQWR